MEVIRLAIANELFSRMASLASGRSHAGSLTKTLSAFDVNSDHRLNFSGHPFIIC